MIQDNKDAVYFITDTQLEEIVENTVKKLKEYERRENLADKEQLRPADYWAEKLGVDRSTLWRWEKQGKISPTRIGGKVFYKASDFQK